MTHGMGSLWSDNIVIFIVSTRPFAVYTCLLKHRHVTQPSVGRCLTIELALLCFKKNIANHLNNNSLLLLWLATLEVRAAEKSFLKLLLIFLSLLEGGNISIWKFPLCTFTD